MKLKNTPWKAEEIDDVWAIRDRENWPIAVMTHEPTARAIAALPETLERLERLEEAAQAVLNTWNEAVTEAQVVDSLNNLKKALEE